MGWAFRATFGLILFGVTIFTGLRAVQPGLLPSILTPARAQVEDLISALPAQEPTIISPDLARKAINLATTHPLDPTPYTFAQLRAEQMGERDVANEAALTALTLQPRTRAARMHVVNQLVSRKQYGEAFKQISLLWRVDRDGHKAFTDAIVSLAQAPETWPALEDTIEQDPPWKASVLQALAADPPSLALLQSLFRSWPERLDILIERLVRDGQFDAAYLNFVSALPPDAPLTMPYDPNFQGLEGHRPFNWTYARQYVEKDERAGIRIVYFGTGRPRLLSQVFPIGPGAFEFAYELDGQVPLNAAEFEWHITCSDSKQRLLAAPAEWPTSGDKPMTARFVVPRENCDYVDLSLFALPGLYPQTSRLHLKAVSLRQTAAGE